MEKDWRSEGSAEDVGKDLEAYRHNKRSISAKIMGLECIKRV